MPRHTGHRPALVPAPRHPAKHVVEATGRLADADPRLGRGGYDFLANDSSAVISRTGRWLTDWLDAL